MRDLHLIGGEGTRQKMDRRVWDEQEAPGSQWERDGGRSARCAGGSGGN